MMDDKQLARGVIKDLLVVPLITAMIFTGVASKKCLEKIISRPSVKQEICMQENYFPERIIPIKTNHVPEIQGEEVKNKVSNIKVEEHKKEFLKDSEKILLAKMLYGEASIYSPAEKIAIAFTAINRANDGLKYNGEGLKETILSPYQYSCFNKNDNNLERVKNAEHHTNRNWKKCLNLAENILNGKYDKYNFGQTHYHKKDMKNYPRWKNYMKEKINSRGLAHQFYRGI